MHYGICGLCGARQKLGDTLNSEYACKKCAGVVIPSKTALAAGHKDTRKPVVRYCERCGCKLRNGNKRDMCSPCEDAVLKGLPLPEITKIQEARAKRERHRDEEPEPEPEATIAASAVRQRSHERWW